MVQTAGLTLVEFGNIQRHLCHKAPTSDGGRKGGKREKGERGIEQLLFARGSRGSSGPVVVWSGGSDLHVLGLPSLLEEEVQARLSILQCPVPGILPLRHGRERGRREEGGKKGGEERRGGK